MAAHFHKPFTLVEFLRLQVRLMGGEPEEIPPLFHLVHQGFAKPGTSLATVQPADTTGFGIKRQVALDRRPARPTSPVLA